MSIATLSMQARQTQGTGGQEVRLSTRLSAMHLAISALMIASIVLGTIWLAKEHDRQALLYSHKMIEAKLNSFERRVRATNRDYSVWTEAYDAILAWDMPWLYSNIGTGAAEIAALDLIVLVPPGDAQPPIGWRFESSESGETDLLPPALIREMLLLLEGTDPADLAVKSAYAMLDSELWFLTVTRVVPVDGLPAGAADGDAPRQIQGVRAGYLAEEIAEQFSLSKVQVVASADQVDPEMDSIAIDLVDPDGQAALAWAPPRPGTRLLLQIALPLAGMLVAFFFVAFLLSRYAVKAARRLETAVVEAKAADRAKSQFLGIVSHELRTPMNGIMGLGQLLQAEELGSRNRTLLTTMMNCAQSQMRLIEQLLDIAQIESGKRSVYTTPFNPSQLLREIGEITRIECAKKNLSFELHDATDTSVYVIGDPQALRQIITNLIENAIKFTESGSVTIRANAASCGDGTLEYRIAVADTGIGIDPADHARIFQHLTQVDSSATRIAGGLGLGLSICRWLSDMMCGRILVESALGAGSTFTLVVAFPVAAARQRQIAA